MRAYAKVIDEETKACIVGLGDPDGVFSEKEELRTDEETGAEYYETVTVTVGEYYASQGMTEQDVEQASNGRWYLEGYVPEILPDPVEVAIDTMRALQQKAAVMSIPLEDDETALAVAPLCPVWTPGAVYQAGEVVNHEEQAYRVIQNVTALENQPPGATGMLAIYRPLDDQGHTGRVDDPIPYVYGMDVSTGFFYSFNGKTYLATADMKPCVWDPGTPGVWQWEEVE